MRPKPQLSQQQTVDTKVVTRMALFYPWPQRQWPLENAFPDLGGRHGGAEDQNQGHLHGERQQAPEALRITPGIDKPKEAAAYRS